jgi:hypothetical protein
VDPSGARRNERTRHLGGIGAVGRLSAEIALGQSNDPPTAQIDRGQELEVGRRLDRLAL